MAYFCKLLKAWYIVLVYIFLYISYLQGKFFYWNLYSMFFFKNLIDNE